MKSLLLKSCALAATLVVSLSSAQAAPGEGILQSLRTIGAEQSAVQDVHYRYRYHRRCHRAYVCHGYGYRKRCHWVVRCHRW